MWLKLYVILLKGPGDLGGRLEVIFWLLIFKWH